MLRKLGRDQPLGAAVTNGGAYTAATPRRSVAPPRRHADTEPARRPPDARPDYATTGPVGAAVSRLDRPARGWAAAADRSRPARIRGFCVCRIGRLAAIVPSRDLLARWKRVTTRRAGAAAPMSIVQPASRRWRKGPNRCDPVQAYSLLASPRATGLYRVCNEFSRLLLHRTAWEKNDQEAGGRPCWWTGGGLYRQPRRLALLDAAGRGGDRQSCHGSMAVPAGRRS